MFSLNFVNYFYFIFYYFIKMSFFSHQIKLNISVNVAKSIIVILFKLISHKIWSCHNLMRSPPDCSLVMRSSVAPTGPLWELIHTHTVQRSSMLINHPNQTTNFMTYRSTVVRTEVWDKKDRDGLHMTYILARSCLFNLSPFNRSIINCVAKILTLRPLKPQLLTPRPLQHKIMPSIISGFQSRIVVVTIFG